MNFFYVIARSVSDEAILNGFGYGEIASLPLRYAQGFGSQ
jgi:hypothetical protein